MELLEIDRKLITLEYVFGLGCVLSTVLASSYPKRCLREFGSNPPDLPVRTMAYLLLLPCVPRAEHNLMITFDFLVIF